MGAGNVKRMIFLNEKQVEVIAYFELESMKTNYIIYNEPSSENTIYIGVINRKDDLLEVNAIEKSNSFLIKKLLKELINHDLTTVKGYRYFNHLEEMQDNFVYNGSQRVELDLEKRKSLQSFIEEINTRNGEILEQATQEYYLQLVDEKEKERRTIIILLVTLFIIISLIAKMIIDFLH